MDSFFFSFYHPTENLSSDSYGLCFVSACSYYLFVLNKSSFPQSYKVCFRKNKRNKEIERKVREAEKW